MLTQTSPFHFIGLKYLLHLADIHYSLCTLKEQQEVTCSAFLPHSPLKADLSVHYQVLEQANTHEPHKYIVTWGRGIL